MVQDKTDEGAGQKNTEYIRLTAKSLNGDQCYYVFNGYQIIIRPDVNTIDVTVINLATGESYKAIYFGDDENPTTVGATFTVAVYVPPSQQQNP